MNSASSPAKPLDDQTAAGGRTDAELDALDVAPLRARIEALETELAQLTRAQTAMAHGISHDLRAPLRAIDGVAMQLARELEANEAAGQQLAKIRAAVARVGGLAESLVEYSRMMRTQLRQETVDIAFLVDWALMDLRGCHPELQVETQMQPGLQVWGDERLLRILFDKALDNSRKFAQPGQAMSLRISGERVAEGVHLQVSDDGIGMTMRDAEQPFEPFMRLHGSREGGGDGLGLAIAQAIVQRHGGRIWAESAPGEGATLHVLLPGFPRQPEA